MTNELSRIGDAIYDSDNDLEIPNLRLDMQPDSVEAPFVCFGEQSRTLKMNGNGTLHFYTDDYRFSSIFNHPEKILSHNPRNIVEPNYSLYCDMPVAFGLQRIYQKRWLSRTMQEKGYRVFADIFCDAKWYKLNLLGIPAGYRSFCTRGIPEQPHYLEFQYRLACEIAGTDKIMFVVYGGGQMAKDFCKAHHCVHVSPMIAIRKVTQKALDKIQNAVAFGGPEFDTTKLLQQTEEQIKLNQVSNFMLDSIQTT